MLSFKFKSISFGKPVALVMGSALAMGAGLACAQQNSAALVGFSGQMHAAAEFCGDYTATQLDEMKAQQKAASAGMGVASAEFDTVFSSAYDGAKKKLAQLSAAEKEKTCAELKAMSAAR